MVDWDRVEQLRSKGWEWEEIAADAKVGFHADASVGEPGRALRSLYYQRRSRMSRRPEKAERGTKPGQVPKEPTWTLARFGYLFTPVFGIWFLFAYFYPSPFGIFLSAIPILGILLAGSAFVLAWGLFRSARKWSEAFRNTLVGGLVLGLVVAGGLGGAAIALGCPTLSSRSTGISFSNWQKASASPWTNGGVPAFFFYGSAACPFCSASSWSVWYALQQFGTLSNTYYSTSSPTDVYPNTPEVVFSTALLSSQWVSLDVAETSNNQALTTPSLGFCSIEAAYVTTYNPGGSVPFLVIDGQYFHVGTLVNPSVLAGLTPQQVAQEIQSQSGPVWNAISPGAYQLMAFLVKANGGQPATIAAMPQVQQYLSNIP